MDLNKINTSNLQNIVSYWITYNIYPLWFRHATEAVEYCKSKLAVNVIDYHTVVRMIEDELKSRITFPVPKLPISHLLEEYGSLISTVNGVIRNQIDCTCPSKELFNWGCRCDYSKRAK